MTGSLFGDAPPGLGIADGGRHLRGVAARQRGLTGGVSGVLGAAALERLLLILREVAAAVQQRL